jgi:thioredoxin-like negative regulator of GroEL
VGYYLTLAPEVTLEDSGELATGSFYAGIPHPPGYPVWTLYTWLWATLLPFKNVAWRVALGEATSGAVAAGLLALLVSRGSSLLIEGIEVLKGLSRSTENAICLVSGFVAGMLLGFNGFMWSQSVIVEVYSFSVASLMLVLLCLLRWIHSPSQWRYLCLALFFHGISFTNHQTLIVAAMGIEVCIAVVAFRMGRYLFLGNSIIYIGGLILKQQHILTGLDENAALFVIFNVVGISSLACYCWFCLLTKETLIEYCLDAALAAFFISLALWPGFGWPCGLSSLAALAFLVKLAAATRKLGLEWLVVIACGGCWIAGAAFYFYMPLAGMTNPPMEWGYPRTVEGFIHAFTRGQYEKTNPTDVFHDPTRFFTQLAMLGDGIVEEFNWVYAVLALVPFFFFFKLHRRERAWLVGLTAIYLCLGVLLLILLNPPPDRAAQQLVRVFFTASHTVIALLVGYSLTLIAAYGATHYDTFRFWGLAGGAVAAALAVFSFADLTTRTFFGETANVTPGQLLAFTWRTFTDSNQFGVPVFAGVILIGLSVSFIVVIWRGREKAPLGAMLIIFGLMPLHSILTHWADNEQRHHWFGYYFGHDMFAPPFTSKGGKPLYPEMAANAILFGGTDPGRFCPTYMIFCDSFIPHRCQPSADQKFDRRDVYIITQNALADGTYLEYLRAQYNRSKQIDPLFFQELLRSEKERRDNSRTNFVARLVEPLDKVFSTLGAEMEKRRRTFSSWLTEPDFLDLPALQRRLRPGPGQDPVSGYLYQQLSRQTKDLLAGASSRKLSLSLAKDLNQWLETEIQPDASSAPVPSRPGQLDPRNARTNREPFYTAERFSQVQLSEYLGDFIGQNPNGNGRLRLDRLLLEAAYPREIARSPGGIYPDREIYIPTAEDSRRCFDEYGIEAQRRYQLNQLQPGENLTRQGDRIQISGPAAVMGINALAAKVIFDHNPKSDFYLEESYPLDWMYPYLSPYGIIMKINRQPLRTLDESSVRTDHEFWSEYCGRLIGDWIQDSTSIREIAEWSERVYLRRNFSGFTGDRRFIRDDQAQKAFSKLRSSIAGLYYWRIAAAGPGSPDRQRMIREADFAFRQAFAMCPYNPEALFRYANLLLSPEVNRVDDALLLARTSQKLDPFNTSIADLIARINDWKAQRGNRDPAKLEQELRQHPADYQSALNLASEYFQRGQTNAALRALDSVLNGSNVPTPLLRTLVTLYAAVTNQPKLQQAAAALKSKMQQHPPDLEAAIAVAEAERALRQPQEALGALDQVLTNPVTDPGILLQAAQQIVALSDYPRLELALDKLTRLVPDSPEPWYDLAALRAIMGKPTESLQTLRQALRLSDARLARDPKARDLGQELRRDPRFSSIRGLPGFKELMK